MPVVSTNVPTISDLRGIERGCHYVRFVLPPLDGLRGTPEEQAQLKKNNTILVRLIDNLNDASEEFLDAHGVGDYDYDDDDED